MDKWDISAMTAQCLLTIYALEARKKGFTTIIIIEAAKKCYIGQCIVWM